MKRTPELQQLSRDHHQALFASLKLRRADESTRAEAIARFLEFWRGHGERHFEIEESVLLPGFARGGGDPRHELVARVLTEHVEIRAAARDVTPETGLSELHDLGERLAAHVRLEEDELFPLIEATLDPQALAGLGEELDRAEAAEARPRRG